MKASVKIIYILLFLFSITSAQQNSDAGYKAEVFWSAANKQAHLLLNRALSGQTHITWSTGNHTASPVPCGAIGPEKYTAKLRGLLQNTEINDVVKEAIKDNVNVIMVIGDGMGFNHMSLPVYVRIAEGKKEKTMFEKIMDEGAAGVVMTNPVNGLVTCSAAAGTALATGSKTMLEMIGEDSSGAHIESALVLAEKQGFVTGLVTDALITDATPAAFYAHMYNRNLENEIAEQLLNSNIEVIFGGGASHFIPQSKTLGETGYFSNDYYKNAASDRQDEKDLLREFETKGYKIVSGKRDVTAIDKNTDKVLGLFAPGGISPAIDRDEEETGEPSLVGLSQKALELLGGRSKNFFVMIEAGRIDWEAHDNDAGAVYKAVEEMNEILNVCYNFRNNNKETLIVFTADHETGGLGISYTKTDKDNLFKKTLASGDKWTSDTDPLFFSQFLKLKNQKKSYYKILSTAKSPEELLENVNSNMDYRITAEDATVIFNTLHGYKKAK